MNLELTDAELALLSDELKYRLGTIREEVYHSDTYEFTDQLKQKKAVLEGLIEKIDRLLQAVRPPDAGK